MQTDDLTQPTIPRERGHRIGWTQLHGSSIGLALNNVLVQHAKPLLIIAPDSLFVARLTEELAFFGCQTDHILAIPDWETLPYDHFSPHQDIISERLATLYRLPPCNKAQSLRP